MKRAVFCVVAFMAGSALAADYYVSSHRAGASDSNAGTDTNAPWSTFGKVTTMWNSLSAGDTVHLEKGSSWAVGWSGDQYWKVTQGGTAGSPITLKGDDYGTGAAPVVTRNSGSGNVFINFTSGVGYVDFIGWDVDMAGDSGYGGGGIYCSDYEGRLNDPDTGGAHFINLRNMTVKNMGGGNDYYCGFQVHFGANHNITIDGCTVSNYSAHGINLYPINRIASNLVARNNRVINSRGTRYSNVNSGIQATGFVGDGCIVEGNYINDSTCDGGIYSVARNGSATGYWKICNNVVNGPEGADNYGILIVSGDSGNKLLYEIFGNIVYDTGNAGIAVHPYNTFAAGSVVRIFNNTVLNSFKTGDSSSRGEIEIRPECNNTTIYVSNNIVYRPSSGSTVGLSVMSGFSGTFYHGNNLFYGANGSSQNIVNDRGTLYNVGSVLSYESSAQNGNPLFSSISDVPTNCSTTVAPFPIGLSNLAGSPAIDNGAALGSDYTNSINHVSRPSGSGWDIGAYEFSTGTTPTNTNDVVSAHYYVSSVRSTRSDANSGDSATAPWASIDKVKASWGNVPPGATIHLERGSTWSTTGANYWVISTGGTNGAPITIRGDDYGSSSSNAPRLLKASGSDGYMIDIATNASYITVRDIIIDGGYQ